MPYLLTVLLLAAGAFAQAPSTAGLRGTVTDPSGALVPDALIQLRGPGGEKRVRTDGRGQYSITGLRPGKYTVRFIAKGFTVAERRDVELQSNMTIDAQLSIQMDAQVINVEDEANRLSTDPASNVGALVLGEKELATLSDDPDELAQQLQAMAGPAAGPNGGQIYIDGFSGGNIPPKASIREVRINSNPYSPEYDRPGFGRIEIFTRPGTDAIRGQAFVLFNQEWLNSRSPLLTQATRPPYLNRFLGLNLTGPIKKQKASFGFDVERRTIDENAFILATTLDSSLNPQTVNQAVVTPQSRTTIGGRIDYSINATNTLIGRYMHARSDQENEGIGNFSLDTRAYDMRDRDHTVQLTETAILNARTINELRFQFMRSSLNRFGDNSVPTLNVQGAFEGGGAQVGNSGNSYDRLEFNNITTHTRNTHTLKWGGRARRVDVRDTSVNNFGGSYAFFGGVGPILDANNQPVSGTSIQLVALERYRRTLLFQQAGLDAVQIRALGGGASQFSLNSGTPTTGVNQWDFGFFLNDDWRARPNLTFSYGLRYENQTNISDNFNFSPRVGVAWGIGGGSGRAARTVLRGGFGIFYDRVGENATLQTLRYNGSTQQSYLIQNPNFFPAIPSPELLAGAQQPQQLQLLDSTIVAARNYQASIGIDRQFNSAFRLSTQYVASRGVHLDRSRNINAPIGGAYPFGDRQFRLLTESTGFSRSHQLIVSPNVNYKKLFLFGFYGLSFGKSDAEGQPADPYNLRAEWGPSRMAGIRHRVVVGTSIPLPLGFSLSPFVMISSGTPYNITSGRDTNGDGFTNERPALVDVSPAACSGGSLVYEPAYGCFNLNPAQGTAISRNSAVGPSTVNASLRLARTWSFGNRGESGPSEGGPPPGMGGLRGPGGDRPGGGPPGGGGGGPIMMGGGPGGPGGGGGMRGGGGMFGGASGKKYNLTLSVSARNVLNHANYAPPSGDLSSPYFGEYRSLAGFGPMGAATTYNRKIDLQLRFTF